MELTPQKPPAKMTPVVSGGKTLFPFKAKVKNTFLAFESPLKTVAVLSPPKTVPSDFAPRVIPDEPLPCTPAAVRSMPHAQTPWTQAVHGFVPPPAWEAHACPSPAAAPPATAAAAPLLRLSDFLPSPTPATSIFGTSSATMAAAMAAAAMPAQDVGTYQAMHGEMDIMPCWQGFERVPHPMPPTMPPALPPVLPAAIPPVPLLPSAAAGCTLPAGYAGTAPPQLPTAAVSASHFPEPGQGAQQVSVLPMPPPAMPAPLLPLGSVCGGTAVAACMEPAPAMPPPPAHVSTVMLGHTVPGALPMAATVGIPPPPPLAPAPIHPCAALTQPQHCFQPEMALQAPQHQPTFNAQQVQAAHAAASAAAAALAASGTLGTSMLTAPPYHQVQGAAMPMVTMPHQPHQQQPFAENFAPDTIAFSQSIA